MSHFNGSAKLFKTFVSLALISPILPSVALASQDIPADTLTSSSVLYTLNFGGSPLLLKAGTPYWVDVATTGDTVVVWANTSTSTTGAGASRSNFEASFAADDPGISAFQVNGTTVSTTPEPSALALFVASGFSSMGFLLRRRRRA